MPPRRGAAARARTRAHTRRFTVRQVGPGQPRRRRAAPTTMATLSLGMSREQFSGFLLNDYGIRDDTTTVAEARAAADHNNTVHTSTPSAGR